MKGSYHSRAYHRFFEDYEEVVEPGKNGRGKHIRRFYTGFYYVPQMTDKRLVGQKVLYVFLYLLGFALFLTSAAAPVTGNTVWYVAIAIAIVFLVLLALLRSLIHYTAAKKRMTVGEYKESSVALQKNALGATVCLVAMALVKAVYTFFISPEISGMELATTGGFLLAAGAVFLLRWLESRISYTREQAKVPD